MSNSQQHSNESQLLRGAFPPTAIVGLLARISDYTIFIFEFFGELGILQMVVTVFGVSVKIDGVLSSGGEVRKGTQFDRRGVHGHWGLGSVVSFMPVQSDEVFVSHFLKCSHVIIGLSGGMKEKGGPFFCFVYRSKLFQDGFDIVLRPSLVPRFVSHTIRCVAYEQTY